MSDMFHKEYVTPRAELVDLGPDFVLCESDGCAGDFTDYVWEQE